MTASTYKTFAGPPGGIIITDDAEIARGVDRAIFPGMTANFHTNRMAALAVGAAEMLEFGQDYARACVDNAQALAGAFQAAGLTVAGAQNGFSDGHMLALDVSANSSGKAAARALEAAHIICNMNLLPWDPPRAVRNPSGVRLGVHEVTRWGMGPGEMAEIGRLFGQVLVEERPPEAVREVVMALKGRFDTLGYCFPP
jgi:glycine hydroxymethyltransferase